MPDTITESERDSVMRSVQGTTFLSDLAAKRLIAALGITVIPDPIPEPEGDVIVVDARDIIWMREDDYWERVDEYSMPSSWEKLSKFGPVKIYRLEERP